MRGPTISGTICFTGSLIAAACEPDLSPTIIRFWGRADQAVCQELWQFILAHLVYGFGCASVFAPTVALAGHWFSTKRATAMGIIVAGTGVGGVIYPIMLVRLLAVLCEFTRSPLTAVHIRPILTSSLPEHSSGHCSKELCPDVSYDLYRSW